MTQDVRVGCCGWPIALARYARRFPVVEVQRTFYRPPALETAARWRAAVPADFEFTVKAWQVITHPASSPTYRRAGIEIPPDRADRYGGFADSPEVREAWERTAAIARTLRARVVLFQCPARFTAEPANVRRVRRFFERVDRGGLRFVWEPRGPWPDDLVRSLCEDLDLVHCVDPFRARPVTEGLWYLRLHGRGGPREAYSLEDLRDLAALVTDRQAYVMFNNVPMLADATRFRRLLGRRTRRSGTGRGAA